MYTSMCLGLWWVGGTKQHFNGLCLGLWGGVNKIVMLGYVHTIFPHNMHAMLFSG